MNIILFIIVVSSISMPAFLNASGPIYNTHYHNYYSANVHPSSVTNSNSNTSTIQAHANNAAALWTGCVERVKKSAGNAQSSMYEHRYALMASLVATVCIVVYYTALNARNYIKDRQLWACWKGDLTMAQLLQIPHGDLTHELIVEIQRRYNNKQDPCAIMQPIARFLCAIEEEHSNLLFYQKFHAYTQSLRCDTIMLFPVEFKHQLQERLDRLAYYNNLFNTWLAEYNIKNAHMLTAA